MTKAAVGLGRCLLAGALGIIVTLAANAVSYRWLGATMFDGTAFYDGSTMIVTLALPAFLGGLLIGWLTRDRAVNVAAVAFALFCVVGFVHPFWRIPLVSSRSAHSGLLHYFLYSPLVALAFAALGAWFSSRFTTGQWTLEDPEPVIPPDVEE